ncbi:hypothetical protein VB713_01465 [Anabaena cylindrica UHCC 0172]|uniref:hypothetical protein n=1 Tax=Anabaena cylindrica TaxID=1165 RepID=UPI002B2196A9|nr:hypothetical protein [Anabaena cylindrica]MEA5549660.1 hypothetical protein [Anabaena cylindrica UHCC 0172]
MDYTLSEAPEYVIKNIEILKQIWEERCDAIEKNVKGDYSRHLLLILNDLREEIDNNKDRFSKNAYAKKFFKIQIATYCTFKTEQIEELDKIKREWTKEVNQELFFIVESLSDEHKKFELDDIPILIQRIESKLISEDSFGQGIEILYDRLTKEKINLNHIEFLVDTIILLFYNRGILELKSILNDQLQQFNNTSIFPDKDNLYPTVFGSPSRETKSLDEHKEEIREYYESLTIKKRLSLLKKIYGLEPKIYKVIFRITGVYLENKVKIENIELYSPKKHGKYIEEDDSLSQYIENTEANCVAVDIQGVDSKYMAIKAKQMAERSIAVIFGRYINIKETKVILSNSWAICDLQGKIQAFHHRTNDNDIRINTPINAPITQNDERICKWITSENECHPTVEKWLSSVDWYRQSVEASQSSQEILNSWFAVEKFSEDSRILSKRLPKLSDKLSKNKTFNETIDLWLEGDGIRTVQLLLVLSELKYHLFNKIIKTAHIFVSPLHFFFDELEEIRKSIDNELREYLSAHKNTMDFLDKFIEKIPEIKRQLDTQNQELNELNELNEILYNKDYGEKYLIKKIIELKDDVYNIYRIRNMLVHSSSTKSKLLDYYAKRSREYCYSLLDAIAYKIYQTANDDEIMPLEFYFREIVINANIVLEAVKENQMEKFRNWILS